MSHLLQFIFLVSILFQESLSDDAIHCGRIRIQDPFLHQNSSFRHMILCKSDRLYFRTSIGLFKISSIDYVKKLITVSLGSCSSSSGYVSPNHLSAGFPPPPSPNSLVLLNCSNKNISKSLYAPCNGTHLSDCYSLGSSLGQGLLPSCSFIGDVRLLGIGFHPKAMNCTDYSVVYKRDDQGYKPGMKISFDITNPCDRCRKPGGDCGPGLQCMCHPMKCKDKVISVGTALKKMNRNMLYCLVFIVFILGIGD